MIDLHIHSNNSDGSDSVEEILKKAQERKLHYISITDHDNCDAYDILKTIKVKNIYSGKIIKGIELKCAYKGKVIDVLGYNYNLRKMKKSLRKFYPEHAILQEKYLKHFYQACEKMDLKLTPYENLEWNKNKDWATILIYNEIKKHPENKEKCPQDLWESLDAFRYNYLYNPQTEFYIDKSQDYPSLEQCISIIHNAKGKAFLAHVFIYDWAIDKEEFIKDLICNYKFDGIECYYTKFAGWQTEYALEVCRQNGLYISGGTDTHGNNRPGIEMGLGYGNMQIPDYLITDWNKQNKWFYKLFKKKQMMLTDGLYI